jgi:hypothetical protein
LWSKAATRLDDTKYCHSSCVAAKGDSHDNSAHCQGIPPAPVTLTSQWKRNTMYSFLYILFYVRLKIILDKMTYYQIKSSRLNIGWVGGEKVLKR